MRGIPGSSDLPATEQAEQPEQAAHTFFFGPFRLQSELDIAPLRNVHGSGRLAVQVRLDAVPDALPGAAIFDKFCQVAANAYLLDIPGVARFLVSDGREVRVQLPPHAPMADVSAFLLGSVFGALCHQNNLLPLHASAVEQDGAVTAFLGDSGAGKSTMAACLQARGRRIVSDDICLLEDEQEKEEDGLRVVPVAGWVKLWRKSLDHLGEQPQESNRVFVAEDKFRLYLDHATLDRPRLRNIVLLERGVAGEPARLEPLPTVETIAAMMQKTYLAYVVELTNGHAKLFQQCAHALADARGFRLVVPWGLENMDDVLNLLDQRLFGKLPPPTSHFPAID